MSYDAASRLSTSVQGSLVTTCAYDGENRLASVSSPAGRSTYTYQGSDGLRRTKQEPGGPLTTMVWDGSDYLGEVN
jgi:YD repeat-containing protein